MEYNVCETQNNYKSNILLGLLDPQRWTDRLSQKSVNAYRYALDNRSENLDYTKVEA
jgi:hypothetical protein